MFRRLIVLLVLSCGVLWGQQGGGNSNADKPASSGSSPSSSKSGTKTASDSGKAAQPNLTPPRSDRVDAGSLDEGGGESSSNSTKLDLSAPENDARAHPESAEAVSEAEGAASGGSSVGEFHPWDPHKAAKDVEVGDFYFKRKNYRAAEDRYREALMYKDNDADATYRLAVCLEKLGRPEDALAEYESYLKILPHGPMAEESQKSITRLQAAAKSASK